MSHTIPSMQKDLTILISGLSTTTEMLTKLTPTEADIKKREAEGVKVDPVQTLLIIILRSQVQINKDLIEQMRMKYATDAELQTTLAEIDAIRNRKTVQ